MPVNTSNLRALELLAPAKNAECARQAVLHGADAVYMGAPKFSARAAAGNSVEDIAQAVEVAHAYGARVYVALNTLLTDSELDEAERLIWQLWSIGVDALIVQDMGITRMNLPPIALHASTQTDNRTVAKVRFLEQAGFRQVVLARELSLEQIRTIASQVNVSLECFIHGALCVSYSGQCYLSQALAGRSANRGECAQFCRVPYDLVDADDKVLLRQKHVLSLKDMNRTQSLEALIEAGVTSFKIEGRLKDVSYVKNVTAWYRQKLDAIIARRSDVRRASQGKSRIDFTPDPVKSFNRGFTDYFLEGRSGGLWNLDTPKSMGEPVGRVKEVRPNALTVAGTTVFANGDGLSFLGAMDAFEGFRVNRVEGNRLFPARMPNLKPGTLLYRTFDQEFERALERPTAVRTIPVKLHCWDTAFGFGLSMEDEVGHKGVIAFETEKNKAQKPQQASVRQQLMKLGNTLYEAVECTFDWSEEWFLPVSQWAEMRRTLVQVLDKVRRMAHRRPYTLFPSTTHPYPETRLTYLGNALNREAVAFYRAHGVEEIAPAFESEAHVTTKDEVLMHTKQCLRYELGYCPVHQKPKGHLSEPLFLVHRNERLRLEFDCQACEMRVVR
jgi:putative protease